MSLGVIITYEESNKLQSKTNWHSLQINILLYSTIPVKVQYCLLISSWSSWDKEGLVADHFCVWGFISYFLADGWKEGIISLYASCKCFFFLSQPSYFGWLILIFRLKIYLPLFLLTYCWSVTSVIA